MTFEELVGEKLVFGIDGSRVTPEIVELFRSTYAGGLILFRRNFTTVDNLRRLISDLETALGRRLLVMVDHEGGRVIHLSEGVTVFPDAFAAGLSGETKLVREQGEIEGVELRHLGIDINLAPVLDVLGNSWNPAIGTRSYGRDPELVGVMGRARIEGLQSKGVSACAKHYPGLGEAILDPHKTLPIIQKSWKEVKERDLLPFLEAFEVKVDSVMSTHVVYPDLESSKPATFSRRIIHDHLRLEFGFDGLILTDDLKMDAVQKRVSFREAIPLAAKAGHDLLLICSDAKAQREAFESLVWACKTKELKIVELEASLERISRLKRKHGERSREGTLSPEKKGRDLARAIAKNGATIFQDGQRLLPLSPARCLKHSLSVIFPDLSSVAKERLIERELLNPKDFLSRILSQYGVSLGSVELVSMDPRLEERQRIKELIKEKDLVFFFCWDAHIFLSTRELLKDLQGRGRRLVVILLREPQDIEWIRPETACVTGHGFRVCQIETTIEKLFS